MKKNNLILILTLILTLGFTFNCKAQLIPQQNENTILLTGTWVIEGSTIDDKWVFNSDGTMQEYADNQVDISYSWVVLNSNTPSGIRISHLEIVNITDTSERYIYEINMLNEEKLVLVYQRGDNMGIGKPFTLFKQ